MTNGLGALPAANDPQSRVVDGSRVSVAICTRNRPGAVVAAVASIYSQTVPVREVIVVDQSTNEDTKNAMAEFDRRMGFRYVRNDIKGVSSSRNAAVKLAEGEFVAMLDDDCVAPANWVDVLVGILARMPRVAAVFCNVCAVDYDVSKGLVPTYVRSDDLLMSIVADNRFGHAISAGMAMRRQAILDLGGFDEALGVGGKYHSGEEFDITVRCLIAGYHVFETAQVNVVHSGFRSWDSVRASSFSTYVGIGAMYAKHVKAGKLSVLPLLCNDACRLVFRPAWERLRKGKVPQVFRAIGGMTVGFWSGMLSPIDPVRITYVLPRDRDRAAE